MNVHAIVYCTVFKICANRIIDRYILGWVYNLYFMSSKTSNYVTTWISVYYNSVKYSLLLLIVKY